MIWYINVIQQTNFGVFLRPVLSANHLQHISDKHSIRTKATSCVEVWYTSNLRPLKIGEEKEERKNERKEEEEEEDDDEETTGQNIMACPV